MSLEIIRQRISSISGDIRRLSDVLHEMGELDNRHCLKRYEELSVEAARRSEWITLRLRRLIYRGACIQKKDYLSQAIDALGIKIEQREGMYEITRPLNWGKQTVPKCSSWTPGGFLYGMPSASKPLKTQPKNLLKAGSRFRPVCDFILGPNAQWRKALQGNRFARTVIPPSLPKYYQQR